jgi:uncharacterized protein (DUF1330 family)
MPSYDADSNIWQALRDGESDEDWWKFSTVVLLEFPTQAAARGWIEDEQTMAGRCRLQGLETSVSLVSAIET